MTHRIVTGIATVVRTQLLGFIALVLVVTGGVAYAANVSKNSVGSLSIKNGQVKNPDLGKGAVKGPKIAADGVRGRHVARGSLAGDDLAPDAVTGFQLAESTLDTVPDANKLGGLTSGAFLRSTIYKLESPLSAGTAKGDGTFVLAASCEAGDVLLSGGAANINATSDMVESFSSPGTNTGWSVRIDTNGVPDTFSIVLLCVNQ